MGDPYSLGSGTGVCGISFSCLSGGSGSEAGISKPGDGHRALLPGIQGYGDDQRGTRLSVRISVRPSLSDTVRPFRDSLQPLRDGPWQAFSFLWNGRDQHFGRRYA